MTFLKRYLSYLLEIPQEKFSSKHHDHLEITWSRGRLVLNTQDANYSYGNLHRIFKFAFKQIRESIPDISEVLILGFGAGSIVEILRDDYHSGAEITGIELDSKIIELYREYFYQLSHEPLQLLENDAHRYLSESGQRFDLVCIDLFHGLKTEDLVYRKYFHQKIKDRVKHGGFVIFNCMALTPADHEKIKELVIDLSAHFKSVKQHKFQDFNHVIIAK